MSDSTSPTALSTTRAITFQVRNPLVLAAAALPGAAAAPSPGIAYSTSAVGATGGVTPVVHTITNGMLPPGLTMASNGTISGAATYNAAIIPSYSFTVTATDARGQSVSQNYSIDVAVAPRIVNKSLPRAVVGTPYAAYLTREGGFNAFSGAGVIASRLTWTMSGHPTGLSINPTSGKLSGTITAAAGTYNLLIGVTDGNGFSDSKTIPLVVASAGKLLDLGAPRFSDPCWRNSVACEPMAYDVDTLTNTTQQFVAYASQKATAPFERSIIIARIDSTGRIPSLAENLYSSEIALPAVFRPGAAANTITDLKIADLDQDSYKDIVFINTTNRLVCSLWGSSSVTVNGMPSGYSTGNMTCWVIPQGFDTTNNVPVFLTIRNDLRPDALNYGKRDMIITVSSGSSTGSHVIIMRNNCALNANCSASRSSLFEGYAALLVGNTSDTTTITTSDTTGVAVGLPVIGRGVPAGATVSSFVANTSITISAATSGGALSGAYISVLGGGGGSVTASTTNTSATLTSVTSTTGMKPGQMITGTGIPAGTSVVSISGAGPGATITMSQAATATAGGVSIKVSGPVSVMPILGSAANSRMVSLWDVDVGYFDVAGPNPPDTYSTSSATCPQLMIGGHQQSSANNGYLYIARQQWDGSQCVGDFQLHHANANGEKLIANATHPWLSAVAVDDYNNDGVSDVAVGISQATIANSENIRTYLMPGGQTFTGSTEIISQLQSQNGQTIGVGRMMPYCLDGSTSCDYPSLLVTCDRPPIHGVAATNYSCLTILPNQCEFPGCTTAFESGTPSERIDYPSVSGLYNLPVLAPVVATAMANPVGDVTAGSATISNVVGTTNVSIGQAITGTGIPANTVVTAKTASTITISQNATLTNTGVVLATPVIPTRPDVIMLGDDGRNGVARPFFMVYARNGASVTNPLKAGLHLSGFPANYFVPVEIGTMKIADMNNDNVPDLFANIVNQGTVSLYLSNSASTPAYGINSTQTPNYLATPTSFGCPGSETNCLPDPIFNTMGATHGYPAAVGNWHMQDTMDIADIDNDGVTDVAVIGYQSRGVSVAPGSASGDLSSSILFDVGSGADVRPQALSMADLDQDGFVDIVVASILATGTQTAYISWLKGNGDGTFETAQSIPGITSLVSSCNDPRSIATPDIDNDGRPEIAILCYNSPASVINIARRHTNGNWILQSNATINASGAANGTVMKWGRLTSTTGLDVVVGGLHVTSSMRIINDVTLSVTNAATGSFTVSSSPGSYLPLYGYISDLDIADMNADGLGDIIVSIQTQSGTTSHWGGVYYTCMSTGTPGTCNLVGWGLEGYQITSVVAKDVNADGLPDIFTGYRANSTGVSSMIYRTIGRAMNLSQ